MKNIEIEMGNIVVAKDNDSLIALGIGSCLVVTLYDPKRNIGALAHTMLPAHRLSFEVNNLKDERRKRNLESPDTKYADIAIEEMVKRMEALGAKIEDMEAKLIGGANMFPAFESNIGKNNISSARDKLKKLSITIVGECIGGFQGRSVEFSVATGIVTIKTKF